MRATIETQTQRLNFITAESAHPELAEFAHEKAARDLGGIAVGSVCDVEPVSEQLDDTNMLLGSLRAARQGDEMSRSVIETNVRTDVAERLYKAAHVSEIQLTSTPNGLSQNGRLVTDIYKNAYKHMSLNEVMRERTELEYRNAILFNELDAHGVLETHDAVVFSMTPQDEPTRGAYNFYTDTDSISIQYLRKQGVDLTLETAMVAGKTAPDALRHDIGVIGHILEEAGADVDTIDDNESLQFVLLLDKQNSGGIQDVVRHYDEINGGTFYGQHVPIEDYEEHRDACRERETSFDDIVQKVVADLLRDADSFRQPMEALERLDELSDKYCAEAAVKKQDISLEVFGPQAAAYLQQARHYAQAGNTMQVEHLLGKAQKVSTSSSCPMASKLGGTLFGDSLDGGGEDALLNSLGDDEDKYGSLTFSCPRGHKNRRPRNQLLEKCKTCNVSVRC